MPDNFVLTGPAGTALNIGTYVRADPGADFGAKGLLHAQFAENPAADGGMLAIESAGVRHMAFPMLLPSGGAGLSLTSLESLIRLLARPNATIDLQPDGVASAEAVRFDVLAGRLEEDYNIWHNRVGRRMSTLRLDVQPYGYWPTTILLASAVLLATDSGVKDAVSLSIPAGSVIGDVPGYAIVTVTPTVATHAFLTGTWLDDAFVWSLGARHPSFRPDLWGGSFIGINAYVGDRNALGALGPSTMATGADSYMARTTAWTRTHTYRIPSSLEPAYRGRFRAFGIIRSSVDDPAHLNVSLDAIDTEVESAALASAAPVATLWRAGSVSAGYQLLDLGEITLPPYASGIQRPLSVRVWAAAVATPVATMVPRLGGVFLQNLDGPAGVLPRGLLVPSNNPAGGISPQTGRLVLDGITQRAVFNLPTTATSLSGDAFRFYRGVLPLVAPSTLALDVFKGQRKYTGGTDPLVISSGAGASWTAMSVSVAYRPRFAFIKGL